VTEWKGIRHLSQPNRRKKEGGGLSDKKSVFIPMRKNSPSRQRGNGVGLEKSGKGARAHPASAKKNEIDQGKEFRKTPASHTVPKKGGACGMVRKKGKKSNSKRRKKRRALLKNEGKREKVRDHRTSQGALLSFSFNVKKGKKDL